LRLIEPPKRWKSVTTPALAWDFLKPAFLHRCFEIVFVTMFSTSLMILGRTARSSLIWMGKLITHWRMGLMGSTSSTRWIALSDMRRPPQLGQNPRRLQLNATKCSLWQESHLALRNPWAKIPHLRYSLNSFSTKSGSGRPHSSCTVLKKVSRFSCTIL